MTLYESMLAAADPTQVEGLSRFFKTGPGQYGEGDKFLGIKVPITRSIVKACWRETDWTELERCIGSEYHEVRLAALLSLVEVFSKPKAAANDIKQRCIDFYLAHTEQINNWDLVDLSCYPLLGQWLLDKDRTLLYDLARSGRTIWEQRIGIVSTMTFIRHGQLEDTFAIADILLHHPHDLIHKAVGWLLREAGKRDQAALERWLQETPDQVGGDGMPAPDRASLPRYRQMPRTMLRYAIERFPEELRQSYLNGTA
ncbi:MAG: DNA alkylation repair protein [Bacteroidales bacterium]|nr:DNA alkylation repair protein [Bacteroidales bacterium]MBR1781908.1 DNA alkylation repair protein [Bacteroidales bacterium]